MSRVGKLPISLPQGVAINVGKDNHVTVKGPKGQLDQRFPADITIELDKTEARLTRPSDAKHHRSLHGLSRALLYNMVAGVSTGFTRILEIQGVGYRAAMMGDDLVMMLGYSHPVQIMPPADVTFAVDKPGRQITISGIDKQVVGQLAAQIRKLRPPEPYKGKGVRYQGEIVRQKAGKAGKVGA